MRFRALSLLSCACLFLVFAFPRAGTDPVRQESASETVPAHPACLGKFAAYEEAEDFLRTAKIVEGKRVSVGVTAPQKLTLEKDGRQEFAVYKSVEDRKRGITQLPTGPEMDFKDSWKLEIGAYVLDKLLGLNMVPPTVERTYGGKKGSVQLWIDGCITEGERAQKGMEPADRTSWGEKVMTIRTFDALIYNIDRNAGNILITPDWKAVLIDHSRSFKGIGELRAPKTLTYFSRSLMEALAKLDEKSIRDQVGDHLNSIEIRTTLERRDKILALYKKAANSPDAIYP